jgi:DNA-binding MarR family transcriptional regulator
VVENIMMIFELARGLRKPIQERTLVGTGLTIEKADLLVILYLEHPIFAKRHGIVQTDGFVRLGNLSESLLHSISPSKFLVSRWLSELLKKKQVETRNLDSKRKEVRITSDGIKLVEPIWRNYAQLAEELLDGIPDAERDAHREVNQAVSWTLRPVWLKGLIRGANKPSAA